MRVLLIYPNAKKEIIAWGDMGAIAEPIALEYIGSTARLRNHEVKLLDLRLHNDRLNAALLDFQPDIVGMTGYSMHVLRCLEVCKLARELVPNCKTVIGGHHATLESMDFFEPQIDYVVSGEGTLPFGQILDRLAEDHDVDGIPGVWSRVNGEFRFGGDPPALEIDSIPPPDRDLVPEDRGSYYIDWMKPIALMRTTVGCPYRCTFCSLWRIMDGRYYLRDVERVVEELKAIPERYVFFVDDEPFVNPSRMKALADCIEEAEVDKEYFSYCRIDSFLKDAALMEQWHRIGLTRLLIGVETIFDHELEDYNKRQERAQIVEGIQRAREIGISLFCNFIIHPNYTENEFAEVIRFVQENGIDYPSFTIWTPIPGTDQSYQNVLEQQPNGRPNWDYFDLQHPVIETKLPKQEFMRHYENLYQVFSMNYINCESPIVMEDYKQRSAALRGLAAKILGIPQNESPTA